MFEKNWKNIDFFWKFAFVCIFFGKTALNRGLALFSAVSKPHYTWDRTNWKRTNRGLPVLGFSLNSVAFSEYMNFNRNQKPSLYVTWRLGNLGL